MWPSSGVALQQDGKQACNAADLLEAIWASSDVALQQDGKQGWQVLPALPLHSLQTLHTPANLDRAICQG